MKININKEDVMKYLIMSFIIIFTVSLYAQDFSFQQFVGTWNGTSSSQNTPSWNTELSLIVESDGYYTDSSGLLMPPLYPDSQQVEFDSETNRVHFYYLSTVYAGNYFYTHFFYEVIHYDGTNLHLAYNFWDDPEPYPDTQLIILEREGNSSEGVIEGYVKDFDAEFPIAAATVSVGEYSTQTDETGYFNITAEAGNYDLTVSQEGHLEFEDYIEVIADESLFFLIDLQHMYNPPENLDYEFTQTSVELFWDEALGVNLSGYHIYRNSEVVGFTTDTFYQETELADGTYSYTISAIYGDYESSHSNQAIIEIFGNTSAEENNLPSAHKLWRNYPNPFNPTTNIKFDIGESATVTIDVFNSKGMKLVTLLDEVKAAGNHSIVWNGKDSGGKAVSSGVYFYQMRAGDYHKTHKMILMK
jgi:hypothetical protein